MKTTILINPQWQGEGRNPTYYGAQEIKQLYLKDRPFIEVPIDPDSPLDRRHDIFGFDIIKQQMKAARRLLDEAEAKRVVTIGGSCSADIPSAAYLNHRYGGDMALIYIDAHGDLNSPEESPSGLLYGMPARVLLGDDGGLFGDIVTTPLLHEQLIHLAVRGWDKTEWNYLTTHAMRHIPFDQLEADPRQVVDQLKAMGFSRVYIHLDVDVLDSEYFQNMTLPGSPGMKPQTLLKILGHIKETLPIVGIGIYQYAPGGKTNDVFGSIMDFALGI